MNRSAPPVSPQSRFSREFLLPLFIGILLGASQPVAAQQDDAGKLFVVPEGDRDLRRRLERTLMPSSTARWPAGWRLVADLGRASAPLVASQLASERHQKRRMLLIAALQLARGRGAKLLQISSLRERTDLVFAQSVVALGPQATSVSSRLSTAVRTARRPWHQLVACLALARAPIEMRRKLMSRRFRGSEDPGVLAAALYCYPDLDAAAVRRAAQRANGHRHLVWRGWLLGGPAGDKADGQRQRFAIEYLSARDPSYRAEAVALLARRSPPERVSLQNVDEALLPLLGCSPAWRQRLMQAKLLPAVPPASEALMLRQRLLILRLLAIPESQLVTELTKLDMGLPKELVQVAALCVAMRLFREPKLGAKVDVDRVRWRVAEGVWVKVALGVSVTSALQRGKLQFDSALLARSFDAVRSGRMAAADCARMLEQVLWDKAAHPGRAAVELQRQLFFDLVLDHLPASRPARVLTGDPYEARGAEGEGLMLEVVAAYYEFIRSQEPWALAEHRLRW